MTTFQYKTYLHIAAAQLGGCFFICATQKIIIILLIIYSFRSVQQYKNLTQFNYWFSQVC